METGQDSGAPHTSQKKKKSRKMMERGGIDGQQGSKTGHGGVKRAEEWKRDTRMNGRSDSCFSFYKRSAAMCPLSSNTVGIALC